MALYVTHLLALISDLYKENITVVLSTGTNLLLNMKTMSSRDGIWNSQTRTAAVRKITITLA